MKKFETPLLSLLLLTIILTSCTNTQNTDSGNTPVALTMLFNWSAESTQAFAGGMHENPLR